MRKKNYILPFLILVLYSCLDDSASRVSHENPATFREVGSIDLGETGASEISAYDPISKKLFVVNNSSSSTIDVINLSNPSHPVKISSIDITPYGGGVNSVSVHFGKVAAAVEGARKTDNGKIVVFDCKSFLKIAEVPVGALPDMVTYTYDGKYILSANEGEPNDEYTIDPDGSISIISVENNYSVNTIDFSAFAAEQLLLSSKGFRIFGPNATFAQDIEPEYITVSADSKKAYVTLQENNAVAVIDIRSSMISRIVPLGTKDYSKIQNAIDASDKDGKVALNTHPVKGLYLPDAIASFTSSHTPYFLTVNEGDTRAYNGFEEEVRIKDITLDETAFPNHVALQKVEALGRLKVTKTLGQNSDGKYSALYSFGTRSFSIWNGITGEQVFDSKNEVEKIIIEKGKYDDDRSDDKGVELEGVTLGRFGAKTIAFIGSERADMVLIYDVSNVKNPKFLQALETGDAPEGVLFVPAELSPNRKSMLIVSSEGDGLVKVFQPGSKDK